jgi:flagellar hook-basal body complex protein FliE
MSALDPVAAIAGGSNPAAAAFASAAAPRAADAGFADMLAAGLAAVDAKVAKADALVAAFAQGEPVPVHQVTLALEQARLSVELAAEVRSRLIEAYRDFMTMQL